MTITIDGITIECQNKLEHRKDEIIEFAKHLSNSGKYNHIKIWENKRHDLMGIQLKGNKGG